MATNFPTSLDSLTNPTSTDPLNSPSHADQHANVNDAVEALEAKVGVDGSAVTTSHDYKIAGLEGKQYVTLASDSQLSSERVLTAGTGITVTDAGAGSTVTVATSAILPTIVDAKGDLIAGTADNTVARVAVGSNNQVLTADSSQTAGVKWATPSDDIPKSLVDAKGDLIVGTANDTATRLAVGSNNQVLIADSTATEGVKWSTIGSSSIATGVSIGFDAGTASAPSIYANGDTNTGIFFPSADNVGISVGGSQRLSFNSTSVVFHRVDATAEGGEIVLNRSTDNSTGWTIDTYGTSSTPDLRMFSAASGNPMFTIVGSNATLTSQPTYDNTASGSTVVVTSAGLIRRTSSSLKYKKDIEDLEDELVDNAVENLRPVWYRTINPEGDDKETWSHVGLIAEEVHLVEPRLVRYRTVKVDVDENGESITIPLDNPEPEDVDYGRLSVILLDAVQRLKAEVEILKNEVFELRNSQ